MQLPANTLDGLLTRLRNGERADPDLDRRLNAAFAKYHGRLVAFCRGQLRSLPAAVVDEVVQDTLLEAWVKLPGFRRDGRFIAFLLGIAMFKCANARRRLRDAFLEDDVACDAASALTLLTGAERDRLVAEAATEVLTDSERRVVELRWILDYSRAEVAEQTGLDVEQVRVVLQRCKRKLEPVLRGRITS
jgi:RNA polymerase sigma factor (sigma-70 family)